MFCKNTVIPFLYPVSSAGIIIFFKVMHNSIVLLN